MNISLIIGPRLDPVFHPYTAFNIMRISSIELYIHKDIVYAMVVE